jgi:hypothetical protein
LTVDAIFPRYVEKVLHGGEYYNSTCREAEKLVVTSMQRSPLVSIPSWLGAAIFASDVLLT